MKNVVGSPLIRGLQVMAGTEGSDVFSKAQIQRLTDLIPELRVFVNRYLKNAKLEFSPDTDVAQLTKTFGNPKGKLEHRFGEDSGVMQLIFREVEDGAKKGKNKFVGKLLGRLALSIQNFQSGKPLVKVHGSLGDDVNINGFIDYSKEVKPWHTNVNGAFVRDNGKVKVDANVSDALRFHADADETAMQVLTPDTYDKLIKNQKDLQNSFFDMLQGLIYPKQEKSILNILRNTPVAGAEKADINQLSADKAVDLPENFAKIVSIFK